MQPNLASLIAAAITFVGTHFVLSHPLRAPLVVGLGEEAFLGVYSLVSLASFGWMVVAFRAIGPGGALLWDGQAPVLWGLASLLTLLAMVLLLGSLKGVNPALPLVSAQSVAASQPQGVYAVSRHPMMWGLALWALAHGLVRPSPRVLVLAAAFLVLALLGAHLQDRKKTALMGEAWTSWQGKTSYWPRFARLGAISPLVWLLGVAVWLGATHAHLAMMGIPAGVWRWLG